MIGYIYLITNNINGKIYIGQHRSNTFDRAYYGSGSLIIMAVKKYGKENFTQTLLQECYDEDELNEMEQYWIAHYNSTDKNIGYNIKYGGNSTSCPNEVRKKISEKALGRYKNYVYVFRGDVERHISRELLDDFIKDGYSIGRCERTRKSLSKGYNYSVKGMQGKSHSAETKRKMSEASYGKKKSDSARKNMSKSKLGKMMINDGKKAFYVPKSEVNSYVEKGYNVGRLKTN